MVDRAVGRWVAAAASTGRQCCAPVSCQADRLSVPIAGSTEYFHPNLLYHGRPIVPISSIGDPCCADSPGMLRRPMLSRRALGIASIATASSTGTRAAPAAMPRRLDAHGALHAARPGRTPHALPAATPTGCCGATLTAPHGRSARVGARGAAGPLPLRRRAAGRGAQRKRAADARLRGVTHTGARRSGRGRRAGGAGERASSCVCLGGGSAGAGRSAAGSARGISSVVPAPR